MYGGPGRESVMGGTGGDRVTHTPYTSVSPSTEIRSDGILSMALFFCLSVALAYRSVIVSVLWPRSCCIAPGAFPLSASHVAKVWRKRWG